jgi:hypothetical protein
VTCGLSRAVTRAMSCGLISEVRSLMSAGFKYRVKAGMLSRVQVSALA